MQTELSKASIEETRIQIQTVEKKILALEISKPDDLDIAKALEKECTAIEKFIETNRTNLTKPIGDIVSSINAQAKELALPITKAKEDIRAKQIAFAQKIEAERLAKEKKVLSWIQKINITTDDIELELISDEIMNEDLRFGSIIDVELNNDPRIEVAIETRRQFFAEQDRLAEFARQQKIEQERLKKIQAEQGIEAARIEKEKAEDRLRKQKMEDETKRILEDGKRQEMKELAEAEAKRQEKQAESNRPKGLRKVTNFEVTDSSMVPLLYCSPDDHKIRDAIKSGVQEIPGVRIYSEDKIQ